jgi:hypothetical protein
VRQQLQGRQDLGRGVRVVGQQQQDGHRVLPASVR